MEYLCIPCDKKYSSYQSLWIHNKKYHNHNNNRNNHNDNHNDNHNNQKVYNCSKCSKKFNCYQNRWRHEKTCKSAEKKEDKKQKDKEEIELLKTLIGEVVREELKKNRIEQNKTSKKQINNGNIYNGKVINNNITINAPGHEQMSLTKEDVESVLRDNIMSVITYIQRTNFNKEKSYNHNFCATNRDGKYLLSYDQETSSIKSTKKKYFYQEVISNAISKIDRSYMNHKEKFNKVKQQLFEDIIARLKEIKDYDFNNKILKGLFDELNLLCYNLRDVVLNTWSTSDISMNETHDMEIDENCKEIFIPVQEYLEIYNNENKVKENDSESTSSVRQLLIRKKKNVSKYMDSDSSDIDL